MSDVSEALIIALMAHMVRTERLTADDVDDIATGLEEAGNDEAAHLCRYTYVKGVAPTQSEWEADRRRARFHVIASPDGGKQQE